MSISCETGTPRRSHMKRPNPAGAIESHHEVQIDKDATVSRSPTSEEEQLQQATHILRLRLVEPARKLADAEMIAGHLSHREAVRIRFVDPEDRPGKGGARLPPGDASPGDRLCFWRDRPTARHADLAGGPRFSAARDTKRHTARFTMSHRARCCAMLFRTHAP